MYVFVFRVTIMDTCMSMICLEVPKTWFMKVRFHSTRLACAKHMNRLTGLKKTFPNYQLYISGKSCAITAIRHGEPKDRDLTYNLYL